MKKNLKDLVEERNSERSEAENIFKSAKEEKRGLTDKEANGMTKHYNKAKTLNDSIRALKLKRSADLANNKIKSEKGGNSMNKETRAKKITKAMNDYLRSGNRAVYGKEIRDINPSYSESGNAGVTVPNTIDKNVITKVTEDSPAFNAVRHIASVTGTLSLLMENNTDESGFVGEAKNLKQVTSNIGHITLHQKRVGAYTELTNDIMNDSAVNLTNYALGRLSWGFSKALERAILIGGNGGDTGDTDTDKTFEPIVGHVSNTKTLSPNFTTEDILDMTYAINPQYLKNAMFIVSRPVFNQMGKLKDGNGQFLALHGYVSDKPGNYSFRGIPIYVSDVLNGANQQIILGDFNAGYALMVKQGMNIQHVTADTQQALAGGHLIVLSAYMDGGVINPDAFVTAKISGGATPAPK